MKNKVAQKLNAIKEVFYTTGTYPELDLLLYDHFQSDVQLQWLMFNRTWLLYLDLPSGKEVLSVLQTTGSNYVLPEKKFVDRLLEMKEFDLNNLTYLCTFYMHHFEDIDPFEYYNGNFKLFDLFTKHTYGRIVYTHQAIYLFGLLCNLPYSEANQWVTGIREWKFTMLERTKTIKVNDEMNLYQVWNELTLNGQVFGAHCRAAQLLLKFFEPQ